MNIRERREGLRRKLVAEACGYLHDADEAENAVQGWQ